MKRDGLLPRMEARVWRDGKTVTYRYKPFDKPWMNLGTDRSAAIRRVLDMTGQAAHHGSLLWVWEQYQTHKRWLKLTEGTRSDYSLAWRQIEPHLGRYPIGAVTTAIVAGYVHVTRSASPRRADIEKALLSNLFKHAILIGEASSNPAKDVPPHGSDGERVEPPSTLVLQAFLEWLGKQTPQRQLVGLAAEFMARAGNRRIEFLGATWMQVDLDARVIRLPRAKQRGHVVFDVVSISPGIESVLQRLKAARPDAHYLFPTRDGNAYTTEGFETLWQRCVLDAIEQKVLRADQRFNFHALRHYYTTQHRAEHNRLPDLHADPRVTARRYDATKEVKREGL